MTCPRCQHDNEAGAKFCEECAAPLIRACARCARQLSPTAKFCPECAHPTGLAVPAPPTAHVTSPETYTPRYLAERILTSRSALEGERKQVTVLFADLKGSMELLADRDPEEARTLLDPVLQLMMDAVHQYEGTVNQVMGDGIMALFGAPLAHEDHAVRAGFAALRMQQAARRYAEDVHRREGVPIQIRVGLNSGDVVVRSIGSDLHMDYTAVGQTTHLAARIEQMAPPGSILISPETLRMVEGYLSVRALGPRPVKGLEAPVEIYEVTGASPARSRLQAAATRGLTRFVGRDAEMEQLRQAGDDARRGHGQVIAVVGEAGVGKSRLFWEFTHSHHIQDGLVLASASVSYGRATGFLPVIDLLRGYFQIEPRDDTRRIREKVTGKVLSLDRALEPDLPALLWLLDAYAESAHGEQLDPRERRRRVLDGIRRLLLRESQVQPLVLIFEDLHWIDSETQALLDSLVESLPVARVFLLVNYRPEYQHGWSGKTYYRQLRIDPLTPGTADELLEALVGTDPTVEPLKRLLVTRAEGNPFFLEESVRALVEADVLVGDRGAYRLTKPLRELAIPPTAQAILAARIDRLGPEDKRLLQAAAVVGMDVPFAVLHAISGVDEEALRHGLSRLQAAEFVYEARLFPELEYTFKHALTHEVASGSLLHDRRRGLHAAIVDAVERLYADRLGERVELLAHHAERGEQWPRAVAYLRQAGAKAAARSAFHEAAELFERALAALAHLPESPETLAAAIDLQLDLGPALISVKGATAAEVEASYVRAHELVERLGDTSRLFPVLWGLWFVDYTRGRYDRACEFGERLLRVAQSGDDTGRLLEAHHAMWSTLGQMGATRATLDHLERGVALYDRARHAPLAFVYGGHDAGSCSLAHLAITRWQLGYPDQALAAAREAQRLTDVLQHPPSTVPALWSIVWVEYERGDREAAIASAQRLFALASAHGLSRWMDDPTCVLTVAGGRGITAADLTRVERRLAETWGARGIWRDIAGIYRLAMAYGDVGQVERGLATLDSIAGEHGDAFYAPEIRRTRGELLLRRAAADEAEQCFRDAIEIARRRGEKALELRAAMSLARLLSGKGQRAEARDVLGEVYGWFTEGFDTADLTAARALLGKLAGGRGSDTIEV